MAESVKPIEGIAEPLVRWYHASERAFPWRTEPSPYRVWVSEIMLQQTRIEAALPYFERFMQTLPTIRDLAEASEDVLLKLWEGLGYYSRVRNLQKAAQRVMTEYGGELPRDVDALRSLPGIGDYTAGAIASMAFGIAAPAVDGNVLRVMARLTDDDRDVMQTVPRRELSKLVARLVPSDDPGAFNQGLMELGETICLPNTMPKCAECPIRDYCAVAGSERAAALPTRAAAKPRRVERRTVFVVITDEPTPRVLLHKRPSKGLLSGLWELPNALTDAEALPFPEDAVIDTTPLGAAVHVFSHVEWRMEGYVVKVMPFTTNKECRLVTAAELAAYALPTAFRAYLTEIPRLLGGEEDVL